MGSLLAYLSRGAHLNGKRIKTLSYRIHNLCQQASTFSFYALHIAVSIYTNITFARVITYVRRLGIDLNVAPLLSPTIYINEKNGAS